MFRRDLPEKDGDMANLPSKGGEPVTLAVANWTVEFPVHGANAAKIVQLDNLVPWK